MIKSLRVRWRVLLMSIIAAFALLLAAGAALGVVGGSDVPQGGLALLPGSLWVAASVLAPVCWWIRGRC